MVLPIGKGRVDYFDNISNSLIREALRGEFVNGQ